MAYNKKINRHGKKQENITNQEKMKPDKIKTLKEVINMFKVLKEKINRELQRRIGIKNRVK